jgi:hypothetical protein
MLLAAASGYSFEYTDAQAQISLQLSQYAYCGVDAYLTMPFEYAAEGFVATKVLHNSIYDVQGYVGYLPSDKSIYVAF